MQAAEQGRMGRAHPMQIEKHDRQQDVGVIAVGNGPRLGGQAATRELARQRPHSVRVVPNGQLLHLGPGVGKVHVGGGAGEHGRVQRAAARHGLHNVGQPALAHAAVAPRQHHEVVEVVGKVVGDDGLEPAAQRRVAQAGLGVVALRGDDLGLLLLILVALLQGLAELAW